MIRRRHQQIRLARLLGIIEEAADAGLPLIANNLLCDRLNVASPPAVSELLRELQADRLIEVETRGGYRRVRIVATGKWTAWTKPTSRTRRRLGLGDAGERQARFGTFRGDLPAERYVDRDPCGFCGVRRDIGCRHSRRAA